VCDPGKEIGVGCVGEERGRERERGGAMADGGGLSELGVLVAQLESIFCPISCPRSTESPRSVAPSLSIWITTFGLVDEDFSRVLEQ
jgi:hypothetical protein